MDTYNKPVDVISPQAYVSDVHPIYDDGEWGWSAALLDWNHETVVALRWNGGRENRQIRPGHPQSRGVSTWFVVPGPFHACILEKALDLLEQKGNAGKGTGIDAEKARRMIEEWLRKTGSGN